MAVLKKNRRTKRRVSGSRRRLRRITRARGGSDEDLVCTPMTLDKPFPPTWEIFDYMNELTNQEEALRFVQQLHRRSSEKGHCSVFCDEPNENDYTCPEVDSVEGVFGRLVEMAREGSAVFIVYDRATHMVDGVEQPIGPIGIMTGEEYPSKRIHPGKFIYEHDVTGHRYFSMHSFWTCSFTTNDEIKDHYAPMVKDYTLSVAKFAIQAMFDAMRKHLTIKNTNSKPMLHTTPIDFIMIEGCSIPSATARHLKNGAQIMTPEQMSHLKYKNHRGEVESITKKVDCGNKPTIYWCQKV